MIIFTKTDSSNSTRFLSYAKKDLPYLFVNQEPLVPRSIVTTFAYNELHGKVLYDRSLALALDTIDQISHMKGVRYLDMNSSIDSRISSETDKTEY